MNFYLLWIIIFVPYDYEEHYASVVEEVVEEVVDDVEEVVVVVVDEEVVDIEGVGYLIYLPDEIVVVVGEFVYIEVVVDEFVDIEVVVAIVD